MGVVRLLLNAPSYQHLRDLREFFTGFAELGADLKKGPALLLHSLANLEHGADDEPDFGAVDSVDRSFFRESQCYRSFRLHRFERELWRAKTATGGARVELLREVAANSSDDVAPDIHKQAAAALQAFDDSLPLSARVAWAVEDEFAIGIIREWGADSTLCRVLAVAVANPVFETMCAASFAEACRELQTEEVEPKSPLVQDACIFLKALDAVGEERDKNDEGEENEEKPAARRPEWRCHLETLALSWRLGVKVGPAGMPDDDFEVPGGVVCAVWAAVTAFVKYRKKCPTWLLRLKKEADAAKAAAGAAAEAEAAAKAKVKADEAAAAQRAAAEAEKAADAEEEAAAATPLDAAEHAQPGEAATVVTTSTGGTTPAEPATGGTTTAEPATGGAPPNKDAFGVGDIVLGTAFKDKEKWDKRRCQITDVLSNCYKCKMLEGPAKDAIHKYTKKMVVCVSGGPTASDTPAATGGAPATGGTPAFAAAPGSKSVVTLKEIGQIWSDDEDDEST